MKPVARIPWVTVSFVVVNLMLAVAVTFGGGELVQQFGFRASQASAVTLAVSPFLHWNVFHLLANMLLLLAAGSAVEQVIGGWKFAVLYVVSGLAGGVLHWAVFRNAGDVAPLIGASGCVAGCLGFASVRFFHVRVAIGGKRGLPLWVFAALWIVLQAVGMVVRLGETQGGVAFAAHVGGLTSGLVFALLWRANQQAEVEQVLTAPTEGLAPEAAFDRAKRLVELKPNDPQALLQAMEAARPLGKTAEEFGYAKRLLGLTPDVAVARIHELGKLQEFPSVDRLKWATQIQGTSRHLLLRSVVEQEQDPERAYALLELAKDEPQAGWAAQLVEIYPMHPAAEVARKRGLV